LVGHDLSMRICIICACSDHGQPRYQIWIKCDKRHMTSCVHKMWGRTYGQINMKRAMTLCWPGSEHAHIIRISRMVDFCETYSPFHVCLNIGPFAHLVYATSYLSFVAFYSYLVSWFGHDLIMSLSYRFHEWLIFARVRTDLCSNKHEKGYRFRKNQPSVKSV
jgi:hypothetical protein